MKKRLPATEVRKTLRPGDAGTRRLARDWGDRLICVRYRVDPVKGLRFTTVEVVVSQPNVWKPARRPSAGTLVYACVSADEWELQRRLRAARAVWDPELRLWKLRYETAVRLKLRRRIRFRRPGNMPIADHQNLDIPAHFRQNPPGDS